MNNKAQILFCIFILIGIILILVGIIWLIKRSQKKKRCNYRTTAILIDANSYHSIDHHNMKYGIYEYEYQGKTYYKNSNVGSTVAPKIGKTINIFVNPTNPEDCILEDWVGILGISMFIGFGIIHIFLAALLAFLI